jgi:hypothetical protein
MRRAGALRPWILLPACLALVLLSGCGGHEKRPAADTGLSFERLADSSGFSNDGPIQESFEAYRLPDRALRVKARLRLPDGTRTQVAVKAGEDHTTLVSVEAVVRDGELESPPMISTTGPLPLGRYQFEISAQFLPGWQSPAVLRATEDGKSLKGPGTLRTHGGGTMVLLVEEMTR